MTEAALNAPSPAPACGCCTKGLRSSHPLTVRPRLIALLIYLGCTVALIAARPGIAGFLIFGAFSIVFALAVLGSWECGFCDARIRPWTRVCPSCGREQGALYEEED